MDKKTFQQLTVHEQVQYMNYQMRQGRSLTNVCEELGISKSIAAKFKRNGYVFSNNQYIAAPIEGQLDISNIEVNSEKVASTINNHEDLIIKEYNTNIYEVLTEKGRPRKDNKVKTNITLDKEIKKSAKIYCIENNITLSDLIEELLKQYIKKY